MTRDFEALVADLKADSARIIAIAGPPAAGKSTFAQTLLERLNADRPGSTALVPMDGFHFDDAVLRELGRSARKGAPDTFDVLGLRHALTRIREAVETVAVPVFDRGVELSRAAARLITPGFSRVLVEGNYLLLDAAPWTDLAPLFDRTIFISVPEAELCRRLTERWRLHGREDAAAAAWIEGNDLPNVRLALAQSRAADILWDGTAPVIPATT